MSKELWSNGDEANQTRANSYRLSVTSRVPGVNLPFSAYGNSKKTAADSFAAFWIHTNHKLSNIQTSHMLRQVTNYHDGAIEIEGGANPESGTETCIRMDLFSSDHLHWKHRTGLDQTLTHMLNISCGAYKILTSKQNIYSPYLWCSCDKSTRHGNLHLQVWGVV